MIIKATMIRMSRMKKRKEVLMVKRVSILLLVMVMLVACAAIGLADASSVNDPSLRFEETQVLNLVLANDEPFRDGETYDDNVWTRWCKDVFNVELNYYWSVPSNSYVEKLRLDLASGSPMPDILWLPDNALTLATELMQSGMFREVKSLFDEYATDTWKNALYNEENILLPYTINGEVMALPVLNQNMNYEVVMGLRGDWLRNLGLEVPTTIEELEAVLDAFTYQDPDGNGVDDTYGLVCGMSDGFVNAGGDLGCIFGMFDTLNTYWQDYDGDGKLEYGSVQPGAKEALETLARWYAKGYMNPECGLYSGMDQGEEFAAGKGGVYFAARFAFETPYKVSKNFEGAELLIAPLPVGPNGSVMRHASPSTQGCILISKDCKNPEAFFRIQDWLFTYYADPEIGGICEYGMFEGYDYVMVDGRRSTSASDFGDQPRSRFYIYSFVPNGAKIPETRLMTYYKMHEGIELTSAMEWQYAWNADQYDIDAGYVTVLQQDCRRDNLFNASPTKTMLSRSEYLNKLELETYLKIVYGEMDIDAFDTFVEQWYKLGGEKITEEVNEWYASVKDVK